MASSSSEVKKNIAVIGGGTGLTSAWALENQAQCKVTLFEKNTVLGGHINSIALEGNKRGGGKMAPVILEGGAEFIGPTDKYTNFHKLCQHLQVELKNFELNIVLYNSRSKDKIFFPPLRHTSDGSDSPPSGCFSFFRRGQSQREIHLSIHTLLGHLDDLLNMKAVIDAADGLEPGLAAAGGPAPGTEQSLKLAAQVDTIRLAKEGALPPKDMITLAQFVTRFVNGDKHKQKFADNILYFMIAAGWGVLDTRIKTFGAHYAMNYLRAGSNWFDAPKGLSTYIEAMRAECGKARFELNTSIKRVEPVETHGQLQYRLVKEDDTYVADEEGSPILYDDVIISTPAYITKDLLAGNQNQAIQDLIQKLEAVEYYETTIAFHQDPGERYRSDEGTIVYTYIDPVKKLSFNNICKDFKFPEGEVAIVKSWIPPGEPMPKNVLAVKQYHHPAMNRAYYEAQQALHHAQGLTGLWFGGILAGNSDAHESGVSVALEVAARISDKMNCLAENERLVNIFPDIVNMVSPGTCVLTSDDEENQVSPAMSSSGF